MKLTKISFIFWVIISYSVRFGWMHVCMVVVSVRRLSAKIWKNTFADHKRKQLPTLAQIQQINPAQTHTRTRTSWNRTHENQSKSSQIERRRCVYLSSQLLRFSQHVP